MTRKHILVTGGTGFIGAALVRRLVETGHRVRVFDNNSRGAMRRLTGIVEAADIVHGDVRNSHAVLEAMSGMDAVCHLAYVNGTRYFYERPDEVLEIAVKGIMNVLDACAAYGVGELILASSSEVYQNAPVVPTDESVPLVIPDVLNPRYSYGGGKLISELLALNYGRTRLERVVVFRPHNVYGPDMGWEHVIPEFITRLAQHPTGEHEVVFPIQGTGSETRSFVFIDDFIDGVMLIIEKGAHLGIYHVGTQEEVTVRALAETVARTMARRIRIVPGPVAPGSAARRCPDTTRLTSLGYAPRVALSEGIARTVDWYLRLLHLAAATTNDTANPTVHPGM